ncbi:hypothetical protein OF83DRAFT_1069144 [Amylostereum chailletii]|nr:hypothetical protein OF83DRAFT_1069144 [Amylostereum chailletii]
MDRYINEYELDADGKRIPEGFGWKLTQRAKDAETAKWQRLMDNRPPMAILPRDYLPVNGSKPPLLFYGFPFKKDYLANYARRHALEHWLSEIDRISLGTDAIRFAEFKDEDFTMPVMMLCSTVVINHLEAACGDIRLDVGTPLSFEWDGIVAFWSNYTMEARLEELKRGKPSTLEEVVAIVGKAMNEDGHETELKWWWDFQNDVVRAVHDVLVRFSG